MKALATSTVVAAPVGRIGSLLADTPGYPARNATVDKVDGTVSLGAKLKLFPKLTPGKCFAVKVKELVPNQPMV